MYFFYVLEIAEMLNMLIMLNVFQNMGPPPKKKGGGGIVQKYTNND